MTVLDRHPATLCWCGHAYSVHTDRRRTIVGPCRAVNEDNGEPCPCTRYRQDGDPIEAGLMNELMLGQTMTMQYLDRRYHGRLLGIEHDNGITTLLLDGAQPGQPPRHLRWALPSHSPVLITIDWGDL